MDLKAGYVNAVRAARAVAEPAGVLRALERSRRPALRHARTLFAVHDPHDMASLDLAWWNYATLRAVDDFLAARPKARVFEYGSGASTAWLARRADRVVSVEHDPGFAKVVHELVDGAENVEVLTVPARRAVPGAAAVTSQRPDAGGLDFSDYVAAIDRAEGAFDLVCIDGRARLACLRRAVEHLAPAGMILLDDVERPRYRPALTSPGFDIRLLRGRTPCLPYPTSTALLWPQTSGQAHMRPRRGNSRRPRSQTVLD